MRNLINFWNKDLINKLILLISLALTLSFLFILYLFLTMPKNSLFYTTFFPNSVAGIPTLGVNQTETTVPTITMVVWPSATPQLATPTITPFPSATLPPPTPTLTPEPSTALPSTVTPTLASALAANCVPHSDPQTGKVVDIVDGNTIKVLIKEDVYTVRYLGLQVPNPGDPNELFGPEVTYMNGTLVFAKDVRLFQDVTDKDGMGRLLRYVMQGETFVNYELVRLGYAAAVDTPPDSACAQIFKGAEQSARQALLGVWKYAPTLPSP